MHEWLGCWCQQLGVLLLEGGEVKAGSAQEILRLSDVHPVALEVERVELSISTHSWESLLLDGCWAELDAAENGWVENVYTGVNAVSDELDWLLDEAINARLVVWLVNNDTVFRWLLDLGDNDGSLVSMGLVECGEVGEWVVADNVGVEHEEWLVVLAENLLSELEWASGSEWLGLDGECDLNVILLLVL